MSERIEKLDSKSPIPLYYQLKSYIEEQIETGVWEAGTQIPSELELSEQFNISRTTIRQAIGDLVNERKLERIQGRGPFVSEISIEKQIERVSGFSQDMRMRGLVPTSDILNFEVVKANPAVAKALKINEGDDAILLKRLRKGNNKRIALEVVYMDYKKYKDFLSVNLANESLYEMWLRSSRSGRILPTGDRVNQVPGRRSRTVGYSKGRSGLLFPYHCLRPV